MTSNMNALDQKALVADELRSAAVVGLNPLPTKPYERRLRAAIDAALSALAVAEAVEPGDWVLVPRQAIIESNEYESAAASAYIAMLAASPPPASSPKVSEMVEQAFRDGLVYATSIVVTDPDEAWRTSRGRAALSPDIQGDGWQPITTARKVVNETVLLRLEHVNYAIASPDEKHRWEEVCTAYWTDFNGGGWVWHGLAGTPTHWRDCPASPSLTGEK